MELTFVTDLGESFVVEIDPNMELENVMALLEAESGIPVNEQSVSHEGRDLNNPKATMAGLGVGDHAMLLLRRREQAGSSTLEQGAELTRLRILGDPALMSQLQSANPELAAAVRSDPARFTEILSQTYSRQLGGELAQLNTNPFDVEAQRRIEEEIRQQAVMENFQHAIEHTPEAFGRVTMLYIETEVNGHPVKAFVDSGAQQTVMSPQCAEACGLGRILDTRYGGYAVGVGRARILGRIHSAPLKLADLYLPCSFTVIEGRDMDLLFGLDMLKAHQACIDLEKGVLRIQGREVRFLAEHELPDIARREPLDDPTEDSADPTVLPGSSAAPSDPFPGAGHTLGAAPVPVGARAGGQATGSVAPVPARHSEQAIQTLMSLGATREVAIQSLDAAGGNLDVAASLLF